jgi:hypothetical protein
MPIEFGYFEGEDGYYADFSIPKLGKIISCGGGCICNNIRISINPTMRR